MSKVLQIILISILTLITIIIGRFAFQKLHVVKEIFESLPPQHEISEEHCRMMPDMPGCEIYNVTTGSMSGMDHIDMIIDINSYLHEMIPHHQEAVDSSQTFIDKTLFLWDDLDSLQTIAQNIISGQVLEISQLQNWIDTVFSWVDYQTHYMSMMRDTSGITDTSTLKKIYAEDMILHHQWAIDMSKKLLEIMTEEDKVIKVTEEGMKFRNEIKAFAQHVIDTQTKEIKQLQDILTSYTSPTVTE